MSAKRKRLNRRMIASNLAEAIEQLQRLHGAALTGDLKEEQLQIQLLHADHHLNFAWNIRFVPAKQYTSLTERQFKRWGKYPAGIENL